MYLQWRVDKYPRFLPDFDDKTDIVGFRNLGVYVSLLAGSGFTPLSPWVMSTTLAIAQEDGELTIILAFLPM